MQKVSRHHLLHRVQRVCYVLSAWLHRALSRFWCKAIGCVRINLYDLASKTSSVIPWWYLEFSQFRCKHLSLLLYLDTVWFARLSRAVCLFFYFPRWLDVHNSTSKNRLLGPYAWRAHTVIGLALVPHAQVVNMLQNRYLPMFILVSGKFHCFASATRHVMLKIQNWLATAWW